MIGGWRIYEKVDQNATIPGPQYIVYFMGLSDSGTMEVSQIESRLGDLRRLHSELIARDGIPEALRQLAELRQERKRKVNDAQGFPYDKLMILFVGFMYLAHSSLR